MEYVLLVAAIIWLIDKAVDRLEIPFAYWRAKRWRPKSQLPASKPPPIGRQFWEEL